MIINERTDRKNRVLAAAGQMMTAARTAPKAKGSDIIEVAIVEGEDLEILSTEMKRLGQIKNRPGLLRDAENILRGQCVMLIGVRPMPMGLNCGHCGFQSCQEKTADVPCAFNSIDVGIAVGSACATAADLRLDTRVMYSAGIAAQRLGILPGSRTVQGIAISASSKSPFFDRG